MTFVSAHLPAVGLAITALVVAVWYLRGRWRRRAYDLGAVSDQWVAQHRAGRPY